MKLKKLLLNRAFIIAIIYLVIGAIWILASDSLVNSIFQDLAILKQIQIYKGWLYVIATAALLYYLIRTELDKYHKIESELIKSQRLFNDVVENAEEWVWEVNAEGIYTYSSPVVEKLIGYRCDEIVGKVKLFDLFHPNEKEFLETHARLIVKNKDSFKKFQHRKLHKNGDNVWLLTSAIPVLDKEGNLTGYRGTDFDITERIEKEAKLKESEERHRNLSDLTFEGILIHQEGRILEFNSVFLKLTGYKRNEIIGRNLLDFFIAENSRQLVKHNILINSTLPYQFDGIKKNGEICRYETIVRNIEFKGQKARVAAIRDITWRMESERKLRDSEERYRNIFNAHSVGIIIFKPKTKEITMVNHAASKMFGYSKEEFQKLKVTDFAVIRPPDEVIAGPLNSNDVNQTFEFESIDRRKDGTTFDSAVVLKPVFYNQERHIIAIVNDITEKKIAEEELSKYRNRLEILVDERTRELEAVNRLLEKEISKQREAEKKVKVALEKERELNELKSGFLSMASHEFRTPLTSILSSADLLDIAGRSWDKDRYSTHINKIRNAVRNMTTLLNDVLTISRTKDGKIKLHKVQIDLKLFVKEIVNEVKDISPFQHTIKQNIKIKNKINTDPKLLRQCIENLITNSMKYSPPSSTISIKIEEKDNMLNILIEDNGPGIEEDELQKIFEPFYRIKTAGKIPGSGLGLAIVKTAVETLGGRIFVQSSTGLGTKFEISLPI